VEDIKKEVEEIIKNGKKKAEFTRWGELLRYTLIILLTVLVFREWSGTC